MAPSEPTPALSAASVRSGPPRTLRLLVNHRAGRNAHAPHQCAALMDGFSALGEVAQVEAQDGLTALLKRWKQEGVDLLAISGGDGTMQRTLVSLLEIWGEHPLPALLLLQGGTAGLVPRSAGVLDSQAAVGRLQAAVARGETLDVRPFPTLRIGERHAFTVGMGAFHRIAAHYVGRGRRGETDYFRIGMRLFDSWMRKGSFYEEMFAPLPFTVNVGGRPFGEGTLIGLHVSAIDRFLLRTYARIDAGAGDLRVVALERMSRRTMVMGLVPLGSGYFPLPREMVVVPAPAVTLGTAAHPIAYMADGEFYETDGPVEIGPGAPIPVARV